MDRQGREIEKRKTFGTFEGWKNTENYNNIAVCFARLSVILCQFSKSPQKDERIN